MHDKDINHGYTKKGSELSSLLNQYAEHLREKQLKSACNALLSASAKFLDLLVPISKYDAFDMCKKITKKERVKLMEGFVSDDSD